MLAIVGGSGRLPDLLSDAVPEAPRFALAGTKFGSGAKSAETFRLEQLGGFINRLRDIGASRLVLAGALRRPDLDPSLFDGFTRGAMERLAPALRSGDDALLRSVIALFEGEGFAVAAAHDVVPGLLPPPGVLTRTGPTAADSADARRGFTVLAALGPLDVGQGCVVSLGQVLAIEAAPGTDWMLSTLAGEVPGRPGRGGTFCKAPKHCQDRRVDLPAIGPGSVSAAASAGLAGIAIEAGGVMVLDLEDTVTAADAADMFIWIREP